MYGFVSNDDDSRMYTSNNSNFYLKVKTKADDDQDTDKTYSEGTSETFNVWDQTDKKYYANESSQTKNGKAYTIWNVFEDADCTQNAFTEMLYKTMARYDHGKKADGFCDVAETKDRNGVLTERTINVRNKSGHIDRSEAYSFMNNTHKYDFFDKKNGLIGSNKLSTNTKGQRICNKFDKSGKLVSTVTYQKDGTSIVQHKKNNDSYIDRYAKDGKTITKRTIRYQNGKTCAIDYTKHNKDGKPLFTMYDKNGKRIVKEEQKNANDWIKQKDRKQIKNPQANSWINKA